MGGWSLGGGVVGWGRSWGVDDGEGFEGAVGGVDCEASGRSMPWSSMMAASGVFWISSRLSISDSLRPLDSRKSFFRSIGACRMDSSLRNSDACSIREALGSRGCCCCCSACACGGVLAGCFEVSCRCHEGIALDLGPWESLMAEVAVVVFKRGSRDF